VGHNFYPYFFHPKFYPNWMPETTLPRRTQSLYRNSRCGNKMGKKVLSTLAFKVDTCSGNFFPLGEGFLPSLPGEPIPPGGVSDVILMKSRLGVEGKSISNFRNNPYWKTAAVKLFVRSKGSRFVFLGEWDVSRKIDFKEPEPYPPKKEKKLTS